MANNKDMFIELLGVAVNITSALSTLSRLAMSEKEGKYQIYQEYNKDIDLLNASLRSTLAMLKEYND